MMTQQILYTLLSISLVSVFLTGFYRPLDPIREWITSKWISFFISKQMYRTAEVAILWNCAKCLTFTITLFYTWNFIYAVAASIFTLILNYIIRYVTEDK